MHAISKAQEETTTRGGALILFVGLRGAKTTDYENPR
jgi:hypothetical protein